jgi:S-adenosylmethionine:tRNA ribosyltransferase-isomerase
LKTSDFDFHLPDQLIAQQPLPDRDASRLLLLDRSSRCWQDRFVRELPDLLRSGDLLVFNDTRVIPARLRGVRDVSGGKVEFLLLPPEARAHADANRPRAKSQEPKAGEGTLESAQKDARTQTCHRVLMKSGGKLKIGETFTLTGGCQVSLLERCGEAGDVVAFHCAPDQFEHILQQHGEVPLPPYIQRAPGPSTEFDKTRYQTIYAQTPGAVAAPTAGLHFTEDLLGRLKARGVEQAYLTLHVGPGTFRPVKADEVEKHFVDPEPFYIPAETVAAVAAAKASGRRVIPVGTTSLRALEGGLAPALEKGITSRALSGETNLFVFPPYRFRVANALLTNFHLPRSSLLMLICALAAPGSTEGIDFIHRAYEHAVASEYRFYSYGDACMIV